MGVRGLPGAEDGCGGGERGGVPAKRAAGHGDAGRLLAGFLCSNPGSVSEPVWARSSWRLPGAAGCGAYRDTDIGGYAWIPSSDRHGRERLGTGAAGGRDVPKAFWAGAAGVLAAGVRLSAAVCMAAAGGGVSDGETGG